MTMPKPPAVRGTKSSFMTLRAIGAMMLREISTTYGRSPGGYFWAVLEPAAGIALMTLIFSAGFRTPPLGTNFPLFYSAGLLPLLLYGDLSLKLGTTIQFSRALLSYPRVTFVDALMARFFLNLMTQMMVHFIVLGFIMIAMQPDTTLNYIKIAQAYGMTLILAIGVGTMNSFLSLAYPVWQSAWAILNRPLFLASCIFYNFETIPQPYSDYLWWNPLVHIVGTMRDGYYPFYQPTYVSFVYPILFGLVTCVTGLFLLNRFHRDILDK